MKNIILILVIVGSILSTNAQKKLKIDTSKSVIKWTGSNLFKFNKHYGTVKFTSGEIIFKNDSITGGHFKIDMNTIINTDGKYNKMLVWHLKNEDFFNVEKYPKAELKIRSIKYSEDTQIEVEANLTIKDSTQTVNYKAILENSNDTMVLKSNFIIDRTRWGVNYESKSLLGSLKDDIISDAIEFEVTLTILKK
jgi:polyisoprenoid-binding protein YceI